MGGGKRYKMILDYMVDITYMVLTLIGLVLSPQRAAHPADIPLGLASVRLPQTVDERLPPGSAGHNPFSMPEASEDNRQGYGSSGSLLPETVPPGISAGAWAFLPFPAVSSPHRKARSPVPVVRRLLSFPDHTGRR